LKAMKVGLVGVGLMGGPMARHVMAAGFELTCYDVDETALVAMAEEGARIAPTPAELSAGADVVLVIVPTDEDVIDVCIGDDGLFGSAPSGGVVAICSSVKPSTCSRLGAEGAARGIDVLDVALTKGTRGAQAGDLTLLCGGNSAALERVRPVLESFSGAIHHLGELGAGQAGKTVNNLIHWAEIAAITEALVLGWRLGLRVSSLREALESASVDSETLRTIHLMPMRWPEKDLSNALAIASELDHQLPVADVVRDAMKGINHERVVRLLDDEGWEP
jgi:3-hydroxyisobutyrate dehydrogenase-like beta-hydroxyacid dehydrogenase